MTRKDVDPEHMARVRNKIHRMAQNADWRSRDLAARHPNVRSDTLSLLAADPEPVVQMTALTHVNTSLNAIERGIAKEPLSATYRKFFMKHLLQGRP